MSVLLVSYIEVVQGLECLAGVVVHGPAQSHRQLVAVVQTQRHVEVL